MDQRYPLDPATGAENAALLPWTNGNPATGVEGSYPSHQLMTNVQAELLAIIVAAGMTPSGADLTQVLKALRILFPRSDVPSPVIWVRTDGNDANDGSANTAGAAKATINGAISYAKQRYNLAGVSLTVRLGVAGTYAPFDAISCGGTVTILGDAAAQNDYVISGARPAYCQAANIILRGVQLYNTTTTHSTCHAAYGGVFFLDDVTLGGAGSGNTGTAHLYADTGGVITGQGDITVQSNQGSAFFCRGGDIQLTSGIAIAFVGSPSFALATATVRGPNMMQAQGVVFSGAANGARYSVVANGVLDTLGGGASFIPGSSAGSTSSGGQYI